MNDLKRANVFISLSHGTYSSVNEQIASTGIVLSIEDANTPETLISHNVSIAGNSKSIADEDSFSHLDLAIFIACETGKGGNGAKNLPTAIVEKGATTAIGFEGSIDCTNANYWLNVFYDTLSSGKSVYDAANASDRYLPDATVICGNENFKLSP